MTRISMSELKTDLDKYVAMADGQDIIITENGKAVAKLVTAKEAKKEAFKHFLGLFPEKGLDLDPEQVREERLR
mgnify:CR=1 FL=1